MSRWTDKDRTPLETIRANAGFTREDAANILKIVMMTLYRYESGKNDIPLGIAENMATLYKVPFDKIREAAKATKELSGYNPEGRIDKKVNQRAVKNLATA